VATGPVQKRIDSKPSKTAEFTCLARAVSSLEKRGCYRSDDHIALTLLPGLARFLVRLPPVRSLFRAATGKGLYPYVIARTKYIDAVFEQAVAAGFPQIVVFGAGFDTRALRLQRGSGETKIYELDAPTSQDAKLRQYRKRGLAVPPNVVFVAIDFDRESLSSALERAGFHTGERSLFILEGLLMYLQPGSVDETFRTMQALAGPRSEMVFDYVCASVLRDQGEGKEAADSVAKIGEAWTFAFEEREVAQFLAVRNWTLADHRDAAALDQLFFRDGAGRIVGHVNAAHCLARAIKATPGGFPAVP
jgi:methyltransferase (TIGR00027 family)